MYCTTIYHINRVNWIALSGNHGSQDKIWDFSTEVQGTQKATAAATTQEPGHNEYSKTEATQKAFGATEFTLVVHTEILKSDTPAPSRGDGPNNKPKVRLHMLS